MAVLDSSYQSVIQISYFLFWGSILESNLAVNSIWA